MSEVIDLNKNIIATVANLCNLQFFANIFLRTGSTASTNPILLKIDKCTLYDDACLK